MSKKTCENCHKSFTDKLINPMITTCGRIREVCPICALEIRNKLHGLPAGTPFSGEMAQEYYKQALEEVKCA